MKADYAHDGEAEYDRGYRILLSDHASVEKAHSRDHDQDQAALDHDPARCRSIYLVLRPMPFHEQS